MNWKERDIKKLESLINIGFEAFDVARELKTKTTEVRAKARELGLRIRSSKYKSTKMGEPIDDYDFKVVDAVNDGCKTSYEVAKYTRFNHSRIREINNRLRLGIDFKAYDSQAASMIHYGIGTSQRSYR